MAGVPVKVTLTQVQWHSVRRAEGGGFYTWETERSEVAGRATGTSPARTTPSPCTWPCPPAATSSCRRPRPTRTGVPRTTAVSFYALGPGYTAWERYDHNRIDLVPEKKRTGRARRRGSWSSRRGRPRPRSLTTEREGVRTHRTFTLSSTQQTVTVPVTEDDIPNVFVSVLLVKGRTGDYAPEDTGDPGKPAFRVGYAELKVEDASQRLAVRSPPTARSTGPARKAHVEVAVTDHRRGRRRRR